jgi:hypothetical protein
MARTTEEVLADQQRQVDAERASVSSNNPVPPGLSPLHAFQHASWGWHDERHRRKPEYPNKHDYSNDSQDDVAAVTSELPESAAATGDEMVTKSDVFPSKYLKAGDLEGPVVLTILEAPLETMTFKGKQEEKIVLHFRGTQKVLPLNLTNFDGVVAATGEDDTDNWVNRKIEVYPTTTEMRGQTVDCIRVRKPGDTSTRKKAAPASEATASEAMGDEIPF